jgi:hypothetical protein
MQPRLGSNEGDPVDPRSDAPAAKGGPGGPGVVAVAGEALIDFVPAGRNGLFEAAPGGSPANVAVGLAARRSRSGCWPGSPTTCSATASGPT